MWSISILINNINNNIYIFEYINNINYKYVSVSFNQYFQIYTYIFFFFFGKY